MAADDYDDEERALIEKRRAGKKDAQRRADDQLEVELWNEKGQGTRVPYAKGRKWLQDNFGIDLDAEPVQDDTEPDEQPAEKPVKFGRRVG